jgi:hypothetical protein
MFLINQFETHKSYELLENKCIEMKEFQNTEATKVSYFKLLLDSTNFFSSDRNIGIPDKIQRYHFRNQNILPEKVQLNID